MKKRITFWSKEKIQKEIEPTRKIHKQFIAYDKKVQAGKTDQKTIEIEKRKVEVARSAIDAVSQSTRSQLSNLEKRTKELDDQKRTLTAKEAINEGSDYLIIGRPLTLGNPKENIEKKMVQLCVFLEMVLLTKVNSMNL